MVYPFIILFTYCFDLFIVYTCLNNVFAKRKEVPPAVFFFCLITAEGILFANETLTASLSDEAGLLVTMIVSTATTFALTFLYHAGIALRFFVSVSFQLLALFGEYTFTYVMYLIRPQIFSDITPSLNVYMNLGSKVILFLLVLMISAFLGKSFHFTNSGQTLLLFSTPLVSLVIILFTPLEQISRRNNQTFFLCIYICLAILNITNYMFLNQMHRQTLEMFRLKQLEQLARFQQEKYAGLCAGYKANRSLIHDTKKHYFVIRKYLEKKEYQKLESYLDIATDDIENIYPEANTGNLVIDSFVTSYKNLCHDSIIGFTTDICLDASRIPASDYDLCIILGNLLDNAVSACQTNAAVKNHIYLSISTNDDTFCIHTENTFQMNNRQTKHIETSVPEHGYGLENIQKVTEKYYGVLNINRKENLFSVYVVLPMKLQNITP